MLFMHREIGSGAGGEEGERYVDTYVCASNDTNIHTHNFSKHTQKQIAQKQTCALIQQKSATSSAVTKVHNYTYSCVCGLETILSGFCLKQDAPCS